MDEYLQQDEDDDIELPEEPELEIPSLEQPNLARSPQIRCKRKHNDRDHMVGAKRRTVQVFEEITVQKRPSEFRGRNL